MRIRKIRCKPTQRALVDVVLTVMFLSIAVSSQRMEHGGRTVCRTIPGLSKDQLDLCHKASDVTAAALEGLESAVQECQYQFQWNRWNCSSLSTKSRNPHTSIMLQMGYRESAFAYAISAAGVAHSVTRACSQGRLLSCGCDPLSRQGFPKGLQRSKAPETAKPRTNARWKWGGCSHNLDFGINFSKMFLDSREKAGDIQSRIHLHNNHAGRMAVANNMHIRCKCHGMSGSCQLKTCWKAAPDFRNVGKILKERFRSAILVDQSNMNNGSPLLHNKSNRSPRKRFKFRAKMRQPRRIRNQTKEKNLDQAGQDHTLEANQNYTMLLYYQRSPNFCERDTSADIAGTMGRQCNRSSITGDSCSSMCCGRGYNLMREKRIERCHCEFHWCCTVNCKECEIEEWISVCK